MKIFTKRLFENDNGWVCYPEHFDRFALCSPVRGLLTFETRWRATHCAHMGMRRASKRAKAAIALETKPQGVTDGQVHMPLYIADTAVGQEKYEVEAIVARALRKPANTSKLVQHGTVTRGTNQYRCTMRSNGKVSTGRRVLGN